MTCISVKESKNLKKLNKIVCNLSEKECKIFMEMLQREELLGGSKDNEHEVFLSLFTKIEFLNIFFCKLALSINQEKKRYIMH